MHSEEISRFFITDFLSEINYPAFRSAKIAVFAILEAMNFVHLVDFRLQKVQNIINIKIQRL